MASIADCTCDDYHHQLEGKRNKLLMKSVKQQHELAGRLLERTLELKYGAHALNGIQKLERKIKAEKGFLELLLSGSTEAKEEHVSSSNLLYLEAILHVCEQAAGVVAVQQSFCYVSETGSTSQSLTVDVVAHDGSSWFKVFARSRRALHSKWLGNGSYGDKTVTDFAKEFLIASQRNLCHFEPPKVVFAFFGGITQSISNALYSMGVEVAGPVFPDDSNEPAPSLLEAGATMFKGATSKVESVPPSPVGPLCLPDIKTPECTRINFDVTTMIAWASVITHGGEKYHYKDPVINEQANQEKHSHLWPLLQAVVEGKELLACKTAVDSFKDILETIGGPEEKKRGSELLSCLTVVSDQPSQRAMELEESGRIKLRSKIIFGTGDTLRAITTTANESFVRAASHQGVPFDVWVHASRSLAEEELLKQ